MNKRRKKNELFSAGTECKCLERWSRWSPKWPPTWFTKTTQDVVRLKIVGRQSRPSINGRAVDASIFNLTTSCVVFVHHVGGHFGDHLDHHSKHLHSVHRTVMFRSGFSGRFFGRSGFAGPVFQSGFSLGRFSRFGSYGSFAGIPSFWSVFFSVFGFSGPVFPVFPVYVFIVQRFKVLFKTESAS